MYFTPEHNRLVKELAAEWNTTEAAVVRKALDGLAAAKDTRMGRPLTESQRRIREALRRAGALSEGPPRWTPPEALEELYRRAAAMTPEEVELLNRRTERLGGGNDVIANREEEARIDIGQSLDDD